MEPVEQNAVEPEQKENAVSEGFQKAYQDLLSKGWNPRKARRYLDSIARRKYKKIVKNIKKNGRTNSVSTEGIDINETEETA